MLGLPASAAPTLVRVSVDPFHNSSSQHKTEVEPDTATVGNTIVSVFQVGRRAAEAGGSADIGWATSLDSGSTWRYGFMPGITKAQSAGNRYDAVSDPSVVYDAAHKVWLVASLPLSDTAPHTPAVLISRSTDAVHWMKPVSIAPRTTSTDKPWVSCDDTPTSKFYGRCYAEWDEPAAGDLIMMSTSRDGGANWSRPQNTANGDAGLGGEPLVQADGTVIVPLEGGSGIIAFKSTDGGATWQGAVNVATVYWAGDPGGIRSSPLPSSSIDASGRIYVSWEDCRFRSGCSTNDIVYSTSDDGTTWSTVKRVPIDATKSTVDHFDPGFGVEPGTKGKTADIGLTFYFFSNVDCQTSTCKLGVGYISSHDGGDTWNAAVVLAGPMSLNWLPESQNGLMVGDYITTAFAGSTAYCIFAVAAAPRNGLFDEAMYAPHGGLTVPLWGAQYTSVSDVPMPDPRYRYHWRPLPPKSPKAKAQTSEGE